MLSKKLKSYNTAKILLNVIYNFDMNMKEVTIFNVLLDYTTEATHVGVAFF